MQTIGFIGAGNMATALLKGALSSGMQGRNIIMSDVDHARLDFLANAHQIQIADDNISLVEQVDLIILAIKPQVAAGVLKEIRDAAHGKAFVSIMAGWTVQMLQNALPEDTRVLRCMPNTPALVGEGAMAISRTHTLKTQEADMVQSLFARLGRIEWVEEDWMDAVTAVSGSGPAFGYVFMEALADAGVLHGLPRKLAYTLVAQTLMGTAKMVLETGKHPGLLKDEVCSPAGTAIEAIYTLEKEGFRAAIMKSADACTQKSVALRKKGFS